MNFIQPVLYRSRREQRGVYRQTTLRVAARINSVSVRVHRKVEKLDGFYADTPLPYTCTVLQELRQTRHTALRLRADEKAQPTKPGKKYPRMPYARAYNRGEFHAIPFRTREGVLLYRFGPLTVRRSVFVRRAWKTFQHHLLGGSTGFETSRVKQWCRQVAIRESRKDHSLRLPRPDLTFMARLTGVYTLTIPTSSNDSSYTRLFSLASIRQHRPRRGRRSPAELRSNRILQKQRLVVREDLSAPVGSVLAAVRRQMQEQLQEELAREWGDFWRLGGYHFDKRQAITSEIRPRRRR